MAKTSLTLENLVALGAEKLAQLILDEARTNAPFRKKANAALAGAKGPEAVAALIDRRLSALEKGRAMVAWEKEKDFAADLAATVETIVKELAQADAALALERLLRFIDSHAKVFERIDDSSGRIQDVYWRAAKAAPELAQKLTENERAGLAKRLTKSLDLDTHGLGAEIAIAIAPLLPAPALAAWDRELAKAGAEDRFVRVRQAVAEARGDLDAFLILEAQRPAWSQNPLRAAEKLLAAGRLDEALDWARREHRGGVAYAATADIAEGRIRRLHDVERVALEARILEARGDKTSAQALRWQAFEATLDPAPLRDYLQKLGDFEEDDELARAFAHVEDSRQLYSALSFFIAWPQLDRAARLVEARDGQWDGQHYGALGCSASALEEKFPLAASVLYRALLDAILKRGKSQAYGHGARYLAQLETLAAEIVHWGEIADHAAYVVDLRKNHGRKSGFWSLTEAKPKR
ncbi:hypothetical protein CCR94_10790 [Rhodoblastus sphagnicola]|uniref:Uncharacterized protein n=1 Tax=Rhodoblastus sphagnicola TaxID=333368 RepID=A0A2S6N8L6_9HYPH|nr:DUF6880 family protein [Rhodoblastus sphagnicola]MBB4199937.1 hypothetical protein [Rhodoblastus sphagnicola]PPQ30959.1 hypothetical protein CCR94_10790 [Rhodoblastus sphagnicola]